MKKILVVDDELNMRLVLSAMLKKEGRTRSELFREALRRYMEEQEWKEITRYGRMKAKERGITEDQVEDIVDAYRK